MAKTNPSTSGPSLAELTALANDPNALNQLFGGTSGPKIIGSDRFSATGLRYQAFDPNAIFSGSDMPVQAGGSGVGSRPLYVQGDEWNELPTNGSDLAALQRALIQAGYMDDKNIVYGSPDDKTASAMAELLATSNASGVEWKSALASRLAQAALNPPSAKAHRDPLVISLTNPDDIRAVLQSGSNNVFGKYLGEDDIQKFISAYQSQEAGYQTAAYRASGFDPNTGQQVGTGDTPQGQGTTLTAPPTGAGIPLAFNQQFYADHPVTAEMAQFVNAFDDLRQTLTASAPGGAHI